MSESNSKDNKTALRAVHMSLFPTMDSLNDVVALAESKTPVVSKNEMYALLMTYHNTLLSELRKTKEPIQGTLF